MELNSICPEPISIQHRKKFRHAPSMEAWAVRLNEVWEQTGWSRAELATRAGVPKDSVYKYLKGKVVQPRGPNLNKLADALGLEHLWLREGVGPQFTKLEEKIADEDLSDIGAPSIRRRSSLVRCSGGGVRPPGPSSTSWWGASRQRYSSPAR